MNGSLEETMEDVIACGKVCLVGVISSPVIRVHLPWLITFLDRGCMPSELLWKLCLLRDKGNLEKASPCICCLSAANSSHTHTHENQYTEAAYFGIPCLGVPQWLWVTLYLQPLNGFTGMPHREIQKASVSITVGPDTYPVLCTVAVWPSASLLPEGSDHET